MRELTAQRDRDQADHERELHELRTLAVQAQTYLQQCNQLRAQVQALRYENA